MAGTDIPLPQLSLVFHAPTIKEIALMGETKFFEALHYLCLEKEMIIQDEFLLSSLNNFQVLMKVLGQPENKEKKGSVITLLGIMFPDYQTIITNNSIILTRAENTALIDEKNFEEFQKVLRKALCVDSVFQRDNIVYKPGNDKAREIAAKLMRGRQKVAEIKSREASNESVFARYISILVIGTNTLTVEDCINLNVFQLFDLMERYNAYLEWDIDLRVRLAGGKPDKEVESWMRNLHND